MNAVLLSDGTPVRTQSELNSYDFSNNFRLGNRGILVSFTLTNGDNYQYFNRSDLLGKHQLDKKGNYKNKEAKYWRSGYYIKSEFYRYKKREITLNTLVNHEQENFLTFRFEIIYDINKSRKGFELAKEGDIVIFRRLNPIPINDFPFVNYYYTKEYKFKIKYLEGTKYPPTYRRVSQFPEINIDESSPSYSIVKDVFVDLNNSPRGFFYLKNFTELFSNWGLPDEYYISEDDEINKEQALVNPDKLSKKKLSKLVTLICWKIYHIRKDILPKLTFVEINNIETYYHHYIILNEVDEQGNHIYDENDGNSTYAQNYVNLTRVDKTIAQLSRSWGALMVLNPPVDFEAIFSASLNYEEIKNYYLGLKAFYKELFAVEAVSLPQTSDGRLLKLLSILPNQAFGILPIFGRKDYIDRLITEPDISEIEQRNIIKIIYSISTESDADIFLKYLLEIKDGTKTNFELLYDRLNDARIERYPIVNWFVERQTNLKHFIYAIYNLWKISAYDFYYIPNGVSPNEDGMNPNAYFLSGDLSKYYVEYDQEGNIIKQTNPVLEYETYQTGTTWKVNHFTTFNPGKIEKEIIPINKTQGTTSSWPDTELFGNYHLYQPIGLIGYKPDSEIQLPTLAHIPAFLYYYAVEFDELKDFDAVISFAADVVIEVGSFFATGGAGALRHLRHLKYLTKTNQVKQGLIAADDLAVLTWRGLEAGAEVVAVTSGMLSAFFKFIGTTQDSQLANKLSTFFMYLSFASSGGALYTRRLAANSADDVLIRIRQLTNQNIPHNVSDEVLEILKIVKNSKEVAFTVFKNFLNSFPVTNGNPNKISEVFNLFNESEKLLFWNHFKNYDNALTEIERTQFWNLMNDADAVRVSNWQTLKNLEVPEVINPTVVSNLDLSNGYIRFFNEGALKTQLLKLGDQSRLRFIDDFKNQSIPWFDDLLENPTAISRWDELDEGLKLFAKENPVSWLRHNKRWVDLGYQNKLTEAEIIQNFGQEGLTLVNAIETKAIEIITNATSSNQLRKRDILVSGMIDKSTGRISELFTNFTKQEKRSVVFNDYLTNMHPNLKKRVLQTDTYGQINYNMDLEYIIKTGDTIAAHSEVRALDSLAEIKFPIDDYPNGVSDEVFDAWLKNDVLGYNRNIQKGAGDNQVIQHTCADCFYILDLVTFIRL